jgi:hypothetical protein
MLSPVRTHVQRGHPEGPRSSNHRAIIRSNSQQSIPLSIVWALQCCACLLALAPGVAAQAPPLVLISESNSTRAVALESITFTREPFPLDSLISWRPDRRTRVVFFALNLQLPAGEDPVNITADAEDASHRHYALNVENAGLVPGNEWMSALTIRLSDDLSDVGDVLVGIVYKGRTSNRVRIAIGHLGGGLSDDVGSTPTSPYLLRGSVTMDGAPLPGVALTLQGNGSTVGALTDSCGEYLIAAVGGDYILSVSKSLYDFKPPTQTFNNLSQAFDGVNFIASRQKRTINGVARADNGNGQAIPNVEITLTSSEGAFRTTTTDAAGLFSFGDLPAGFAYTITPASNKLFVFTPQTINELVETSMLTFSGVRRTYSISGRVTSENVGLPDAVLTLQQTGATSISDASGNYSFSGLKAGFDYTLSVSKPFFDFSPPTQTLSNLSQAFDGVGFVASRQTQTIYGTALDDSGHPLPNVVMTLAKNGAAQQTVTTGVNGVFNFASVPVGFPYTVAADHNVFAFTAQNIEQLSEITILTFSGIRRTYTISGRVADRNAGNAGIADAILTLQETGATSICDSSGNFSFSGVKAGFDYTMKVAREDYIFETPSVLVTALDSNRQIDIRGNPDVFLTGRVLNQNGQGVFGVKIEVTGTQSGIAATSADGTYSFHVTAFGNYLLRPWKEQDYYEYTPTSINLTALKGNRIADFNGSLISSVSPSYVLEFDGSPETVDYSMPILAPLDYNPFFWNDGNPMGHFFWEFWAMPGANAGATYLISDGYGGAHAILFGVANFNSREPNRYQLLGNIWNGQFLTYFASDEGPAVNEWGHFAVGWDGTNIVTYLNGVPVGKTYWVGPRITPGGIQGTGRLLIGGSDHANFIGRIAQMRGFEENNPLENAGAVFATFAPQTLFAVDGNVMSYFFRPATNIADLSPLGLRGRQHAGLLQGTVNGVLYPCDGCPLPQFVIDPTAPDFAHPNNPGTPPTPVDTPAAVPGGALIFDSFSRRNSTYALNRLGGLDTTEGGTAGKRAWQTNQAPGQPQPFGILNGRAVLLANARAITWVSAPAANTDLDIQVDRHAGLWGTGRNTGISFRVTDANNYFFAYTKDNADPSQPQLLTVGNYLDGARTDLATGISVPAIWTTLRVVTTAAGTIKVYADNTLLYSLTNNSLANGVGAGLYNDAAGLALTNRWDNFSVFVGP